MLGTLVVALGGAFGAASRYVLAGAVHRILPATFPYGTFFVNISGCFLFGVIAGIADERSAIGPDARRFLLVGVLGGFTTFSSYTYESFALVRDGQLVSAFANTAGQVVAGFAALWAGYVLARLVAR
jgi:CrcB protein